MKTKNMKWKTPMVVFCIFLVFIFALFIQYIYLSISPIIYGINMQKFADNRSTYSSLLPAKRGTIYDSQGNVLAQEVSSYTVIALLENENCSYTADNHVIDKQKTAEALAPILDMSVESIIELLNWTGCQVELGPGGRDITESKKKQIEDLKLSGIEFIEGYKRYYPNGDFASYIIGYAKKNDGVLVGELGIEKQFESDEDNIYNLKGEDGYLSYQQTPDGHKIPNTPEINIPATDGSDIYLTIDATIQRILESVVDDNVDEYDPDWITISVMDAKTGDILGSATSPSFDPNKLNITDYRNPLTTYTYEAGSVMKTFTYMCAIEKGTYKGDQLYQSGQVEIGDTVIHDWNTVGWGNITYDHGFELSSNTGTVNIMQNFLTSTELHDCLQKFGFGNYTNIDLPSELAGDIYFDNPVDAAAASYGQGISITPIQMLQALSIIANDGYMVKPQIVSKIVQNGNVVLERKVEKSERIVSQSTIEKMKELMYNAINNEEGGAIGLDYRVDGLELIGKTGTAEIPDTDNGGYLTGWNDYIYSFSGIFPAEDPEIIIFASVKRPNNGSNSGLKAMVKSAVESIAKYKGYISNDVNQGSVSKVTIENYINLKVEEVKMDLENKGLDVVILGDGDYIINQYPKAGNVLLTNDKVFLLTNAKEIKMPNLIGYSRIEAISLLDLINVDYELEGYGLVIEQSIKPNEIITDKVNLVLKQDDIE